MAGARSLRFVIFTKSVWQETPRLRHQVAEMLQRAGHRVVFMQRPSWLGAQRFDRQGTIALERHGELLHHQLRVMPVLSRLNAAYERTAIERLNLDRPDTVLLSFIYDYYFLRDIAPHVPLILLLNDDFVAGSRWFSRREAARVLEISVRRADRTLVVSHPLLDQVRRFTTRTSLFLPWARRPYGAPAAGLVRRELLYWGYINNRLDLDVVDALFGAGWIINFVGPVTETRRLRRVLSHPNARCLPSTTLDALRPVIDRCAASLLAYDRRDEQVMAITINNRAFDLLATGLPLLYTDLPGLIDAPPDVIRRCATPEDFVAAAAASQAGFDSAQPNIAAFIAEQSEEHRYEQFMSIVAPLLAPETDDTAAAAAAWSDSD